MNSRSSLSSKDAILGTYPDRLRQDGAEPMSDTLKKALAGAVAGAVLVAFAWHISLERAKRAP